MSGGVAQAMQHAIDCSRRACVRIDSTGRVLYANAEAGRQLGYTPAELCELRVTAFDVALPAAWPAVWETFRATGSYEARTEYLRKDGSRFPVRVSSSYGEYEGEGFGLAFFEDLTEVVKAERALRIAQFSVEASPDANWWFDAEGRVVYANAAACAQLGYTREEAQQLRIGDFVPRQAAGSWERTKEVLQARGSARFESEHRCKDGTLIPVEVSASAFELDGELYVCGYGRDISERKRAEAQIRELNADLERRVAERTAELKAAVGELEAFSYSVSHDLKSPLRAISAAAHFLVAEAGDALPDKARHRIDGVIEGARRMGQLIEDLLSLAAYTRRAVTRGHVDLTALAHAIVAELRAAEPARTVTVTIADGLAVEADPGLTRVVLANLLGNAWKFTRGAQVAAIEVGQESVDGEEVFFVRDTGSGFDMAYADKLFQPFQRLHGHAVEGTGIGLATVGRIVSRHGGRVWAEAAPDRGATFRFTLAAKRG